MVRGRCGLRDSPENNQSEDVDGLFGGRYNHLLYDNFACGPVPTSSSSLAPLYNKSYEDRRNYILILSFFCTIYYYDNDLLSPSFSYARYSPMKT